MNILLAVTEISILGAGETPLREISISTGDTVRVSSVEIQISRKGVSPAPRIDISVTASRIFNRGSTLKCIEKAGRV